MKVLNLCCANEHRFEGWFASDEDYSEQLERGSLECPVCADTSVVRLPSAPRLQVSKQRDAEVQAAQAGQAHAQGQWLRAARELLMKTEDVGDRFPEEARRIHYGEAQERGIRGRASAEDAQALREEGIEVTVLPVPDLLKGPMQ